jgi:hypothetical protein
VTGELGRQLATYAIDQVLIDAAAAMTDYLAYESFLIALLFRLEKRDCRQQAVCNLPSTVMLHQDLPQAATAKTFKVVGSFIEFVVESFEHKIVEPAYFKFSSYNTCAHAAFENLYPRKTTLRGAIADPLIGNSRKQPNAMIKRRVFWPAPGSVDTRLS